MEDMFFGRYRHEKERTEREARLADLPESLPSQPMPRQLNIPAAWKAFSIYLKDRHLNPMLAMANAWYPSEEAGDHEVRIVIPGTNSRKYNYWQARAINKTARIRYQSPRVPRTDSIIAVYPACHAWSAVVLCEGPMDALAAADLGYVSIALMGNRPSADVLKFAVKHTKSTLFYIVADSDAPDAAATIAAHLSTAHNVKTKTILTYPYKDLADCPPDFRKVLLDNA
jgi:hypothetical protein